MEYDYSSYFLSESEFSIFTALENASFQEVSQTKLRARVWSNKDQQSSFLSASSFRTCII